MIRKTIDQSRERPQNGTGTVLMKNIITEEEFCKKGRLYAHVVIPPGASFGLHRHVGEVEPFYILKGEGTYTDTDGSVVKVTPGDVCIIEDGDSHAIANDSDTDLELMAMIYNTGEERGHSETLT